MTQAHALRGAAALVLALVSAVSGLAAPPPLPGFDFTTPEGVRGWQAAHDISRLEGTAEGLAIEISGNDPYAVGPALDLPEGTDLWLRMRLKSDQIGSCQVFYCPRGTGPAEDRSVRFTVPTTGWVERRVPLPALGPGTRFRIDPPGTGGKAVIASMTFEPRILYKLPEWPKPTLAKLPAGAEKIAAGSLVFRYGGPTSGDFEVTVDRERMASGLAPKAIGYLHEGRVRWFSDDRARVGTDRQRIPSGFWQQDVTLKDPDGARWVVTQRIGAPRQAGAIDVEVRVTVDQPRDVIYLPMFFLVPGAGSFGDQKGQGLLAGLEYLANEPSSSEADIRGPASKRQVPDSVKITFPLMAIQMKDRYVGLMWEPDSRFSAVFDSPDRLFGTGAHVMGLIFPGSDGENRAEGNLLPYAPERLDAGKPLVLKATIIGGEGRSVVAAIEQYVRLKGLPRVPDTGLDWSAYARLASAGWLDSKIREGNLYRHAVWPGFNAQPAAGAAVWMEYLAPGMKGTAVAGRLEKAAEAALAQVDPRQYRTSGVSHVRYPVVPLVYGHVAEAVEQARMSARAQLQRFEPDGRILYRQADGKPDYGSTHFAPDANGLTAQAVASVLEGAAYCGDAALIQEGLRLLRALDKFENTVPRGAQTWEVPLHTPDILASAYLVRAYTLGYELSGDAHFLQQARYWAWTGVPFLYLVNPTAGKVGPYSTVAVYGGTNWQAPVWFGQPVQWCGLVYGDALYRFVRHDPDGPWKQIADGIAAAGIQHSWKQDDSDRQGLLPDFYHLRDQQSDGPAINPGTVQANAIRLFGRQSVYDFVAFRKSGLLVHAPGPIEPVKDAADGLAFRVETWRPGPYDVLVSGLRQRPTVRIAGKAVPIEAPHEYLPAGNLVLRLQGKADVDIAP